MASSTRYFGIGFFDFGDPLGTDFAGQIEIDRFVFIDKMLFGLMSIFGNGVVNGWIVKSEESFSVSIGEGYGNINFLAGRTTFPTILTGIPANSIVYIYAKTKQRTNFTEEVEFIFSTNATLGEGNFNFLQLAKVVSGNSSIESIDNTFRQEIGFVEIIKSAIKSHKHRGGSLNPSKIDLTSEVRGQLPSFRFADFDAEKITSGTFNLERIPVLDHQDLQNVGLLTHPQLDTFVKTLESTNTELFGEIGTANLLQLIIAAKLIYEDTDSSFFSGIQIDENMINEFVVIPGITTNDRIDFDNTTAKIDTSQHFIQGIPPTTGTSFFVNFDTALAWKAQKLENLLVVGDTLVLSFDPEQTTTTTIIEGFESANDTGEDLTDAGAGLFKEQSLILVDNATITSNSNATNVTQGFFSGKFKHQQTYRVQFVKEFVSSQDWAQFDTFSLDIKCLSLIHGIVNMYFEDSNGNRSIDFSILEQDQTTNNFEIRQVDLSTISFINDIKKIVIYTNDHINDFTYFIDNMKITKAILLPEEGTMHLRYSSGAPVVFSTITWSSLEPPATEIEVRARSANGSVLLNRSIYTDFLNSGDAINLEGTDLELEVTLLPNSTRTLGPTLISINILILTEAEIDGFSIDTSNEFARGSLENSVTSNNIVQLKTPIFVDSVYFALQNGIHQGFINSDVFNSDDEPTILGTKDSPISPNHVFRAVEEFSNISEGLFEPRYVKRQHNRNFIIADTFNDRIIEFDENGTLLSGIGSINYEANSIFPIAACVDVRTGILYLVWSRKISFKTVNVSKILIQSNSSKVQLIKDFDKILGLNSSELENIDAEGQILPIFLSDQNAGLAQNLPKTDSFLQVEGSTTNGVIPGGIDQSSIIYNTVISGLGIPCYIGKFAYIDGIFAPTFANRSLSGGFIITNGSIAIKDFDFKDNPNNGGALVTKVTNISDIIEVDKNNNIVFGANVMRFSPFVPGRIHEIDKSTLLIGGIRPGGEDGSSQTPLNFRAIEGSKEDRENQRLTLQEIFFGSSDNKHVGSVILYDKSVKTITFQYISPEGELVSDVDIDSLGQYVIAESDFGRSGRIIKIDKSGNIVFSLGEGQYSTINHAEVQFDDSIIIST